MGWAIGVQSLKEAEDRLLASGAHPALSNAYQGPFLGAKNGQGMLLTTHRQG